MRQKTPEIKARTIAEKPLVVLGVTGSVAAVRSFDLCRELRRRGFEVQIVMSEASQGILTEDSMEFASGRKVISRISGAVEHIRLFGKKGKADILLVAPATANTISKIAMGIDDTPVTTCATVAIGANKPVLLAPAMHKPMYEHPIVLDNLRKLESRGVKVIGPLIEQGDKAKLAGIEAIVFQVEKALSGKRLAGKKILVASGEIQEPIDDIRVVTNNSSGILGSEIAVELARQGAEVKLAGNRLSEKYKGLIDFERANFASELREKVMGELGRCCHDYFFCPAAIPDFRTKKFSGKISSAKSFKLEMGPAPKLIAEVRKRFPKVRIVAFKALWSGGGRKAIELVAKAFAKENGLHAVVATDLKAYPGNAHEREMLFCGNGKLKWLKGTKKELAKKIVELA